MGYKTMNADYFSSRFGFTDPDPVDGFHLAAALDLLTANQTVGVILVRGNQEIEEGDVSIVEAAELFRRNMSNGYRWILAGVDGWGLRHAVRQLICDLPLIGGGA